MTDSMLAVIEPFVRRGLFATPERAVMEMARDFTLHQVERYRAIAEGLQTKYGMTFEQFDAYLHARAATLVQQPNPTLSQAVMLEEEDALTWKTATEMLQAWLGLQAEVAA